MKKEHVEVLSTKLNINLSSEKEDLFDRYAQVFLEKNAHTNLISKSDEKFLFEKHIFDSLAINLFFEKFGYEIDSDVKKLLDIGTGGGFPSVPISMFYDNLKVSGLDSIGKKIRIVDELRESLELENFKAICDRAENLQKTYSHSFDFVVTRAVASMDLILKYALPLLKKDGCFVAYKSKKALEELKNAKGMLKAHSAEVVDIIEYNLPLEEVYERNLVVVKYK